MTSPLKNDWEDDEDTLHAEVFNEHATRINTLREELAEAVQDIAEIPGVNESTIAGLIDQDTGAVHEALESRYAPAPEVTSGLPPVARTHANSGAGAVIASGGTRLAQRTTVTTGSAPEQGGVLFELVLTGYAAAPVVSVTAADAQSYMTGALPFPLTANLIQIVATSEVEPFTAYTFNTTIFGV